MAITYLTCFVESLRSHNYFDYLVPFLLIHIQLLLRNNYATIVFQSGLTVFATKIPCTEDAPFSINLLAV